MIENQPDGMSTSLDEDLALLGRVASMTLPENVNTLDRALTRVVLTLFASARAKERAAQQVTEAIDSLPSAKPEMQTLMNEMEQRSGDLAEAIAKEAKRQTTDMRLRGIEAKAVADVCARESEQPSTYQFVSRGSLPDMTELHLFLLDAVGANEEQFLKWDKERNAIDPDPSVDSLKVLVDLTKLMQIPGSGFEFAAYYYRSPEGVRLRAAKKALITAQDDIALLGGPGVAADSVVEVYYKAKAEYTNALSKMALYDPDKAPVLK